MGRAAGHLALGIGKAAAATLDRHPRGIPRHAGHPRRTVRHHHRLDHQEQAQSSDYGVVVLAEGLIESIGEKALHRGHGATRAWAVTATSNATSTTTCAWARSSLAAWSTITSSTGSSRSASHIPHRQGPGLRAALCRPDPVRCRIHPRPGLWGRASSCARRQPASFGADHQFRRRPHESVALRQMIVPETRPDEVAQGERRRRGFECARRYMIRLEPRTSRTANG